MGTRAPHDSNRACTHPPRLSQRSLMSAGVPASTGRKVRSDGVVATARQDCVMTPAREDLRTMLSELAERATRRPEPAHTIVGSCSCSQPCRPHKSLSCPKGCQRAACRTCLGRPFQDSNLPAERCVSTPSFLPGSSAEPGSPDRSQAASATEPIPLEDGTCASADSNAPMHVVQTACRLDLPYGCRTATWSSLRRRRPVLETSEERFEPETRSEQTHKLLSHFEILSPPPPSDP